MASRHLLVTGTGRSGTTALMELLRACGLDIGGQQTRYHKGARAGLEQRLTDDGSPYVVKDPYLCTYLGELIETGFDPSRIDAVIVPLRDLRDSAASRIDIFDQSGLRTPGGLWRSHRPSRQLEELAEAEHQLLRTVGAHQIPLVLLNFPEFVNDADYAWRQLGSTLTSIERATFVKHHRALMKPQLVSRLSYPGSVSMVVLDAKWAFRKAVDPIRKRRARARRA